MELYELTLDREGIQGIENKTDAEIIVEWVRSVLAQCTLPDPVSLQLARSVARVFEKLPPDEKSVSLTAQQRYILTSALLRYPASGQACNLYCQLLTLFGVGMPV